MIWVGGMRHLKNDVFRLKDEILSQSGIKAWLAEAALPNVLPPLVLDVDDQPWSVERIDAVFSANTTHIMSWPQVERMLGNLKRAVTFQSMGNINQAGTRAPESACFVACRCERCITHLLCS
ncbi:MAG: DUF938 domain-containing protein [Gammaproteobacteria bacterium]|nr:DUF938 domain-containing protein [Gammaproteobacteria bacterium]